MVNSSLDEIVKHNQILSQNQSKEREIIDIAKDVGMTKKEVTLMSNIINRDTYVPDQPDTEMGDETQLRESQAAVRALGGHMVNMEAA